MPTLESVLRSRWYTAIIRRLLRRQSAMADRLDYLFDNTLTYSQRSQHHNHRGVERQSRIGARSPFSCQLQLWLTFRFCQSITYRFAV